MLFVALAAIAGSTARAADNGYLALSVGSARADFDSDSTAGGSSQLQWRFAGARELSRHLSLEFGVSFAKGFDPPATVADRVPGAHVKAVVIDGSLLFHVPVSPSTRLFVAAGPAMTSARVELSNTSGRSTAVESHRDFTPRLALGIDVVRGHYTAVRVAYEHLQSVGSDSSPPTTGRSALDTASIAILLLF
jgi:hypothetical protein